LGFGIWDLGFGIWDLGFGIWDFFAALREKLTLIYDRWFSRRAAKPQRQ
jgi:hypothetical protein